MADTNIAANFDFRAMIDAHIASGADVTIAYNEQELPERILQDTSNAKGFYYTLDVQDGRVTDIIINPKTLGVVNFGMNIHVVDRELLIDLINTAYLRGQVYFERDVLLKKIGDLNIQGYKFDGYVARICSIKSYFDENMRLH